MVEKFRTRCNAPLAVGAIDGKHIAMKKANKYGSDSYNSKGFFALMLLALVDAEYRFLWVNVGSIGYSSNAQIFNRNNLMEKTEDGSLGLPPPESLGEGGPDLHYFLLGDDAFALMPWMVKPYTSRQLTREERIVNYRISRVRRVVQNTFGIFLSRFRVLQGTMEQRPETLFFTCVMLHNMLRTHQGRLDRAPTPANDVVALQISRWCMCLMRTTGILQGRPNISEKY